MGEKRISRPVTKKKVRVKSKKKVAPLSKQQTFHISKSDMSFSCINSGSFEREIGTCKSFYEVLNQQELEDFEL